MNNIIHIIESNFAQNSLYSSNATSSIYLETGLFTSKIPFLVYEKNYTYENENGDIIVKYEYINDLASNKWELNSIIEIAIEEKTNGDFIACYYDVDVYGYGIKQEEAIENLKSALINQYEFLLEEEKTYNLNPVLSRQLHILKNIISLKDENYLLDA